MGRGQPRPQHLTGVHIQPTPDDRTGMNIQSDTRTLTDHWGLPRLWLYRQGPPLHGNPRSFVAGPQPPYRLSDPRPGTEPRAAVHHTHGKAQQRGTSQIRLVLVSVLLATGVVHLLVRLAFPDRLSRPATVAVPCG